VVNVPAGDFALVDQDGKPFRLSRLRGRVVLVSFIYATCPDVCPLLTAKVAGLQRALQKRRRNDFFLISITTDPDSDAPEVLKSYARRFSAELRSWAFLSGDRKELARVWRIFGVRVKKLGPGEVQHTLLTALVDPHGVRRFDYFGSRWREQEVLRDMKRLAGRGEGRM